METDIDTPTTEDVIAGMLGENTGRSFLDSGSAYGRNWERNQGTDVDHWKNRPSATLDTSWGGLSFTLDVFHFMVDRLEYDHDMQVAFDRYAASRPDDGWLGIMEDFPALWADREHGEGAYGIYGDGRPFTVNTYNHEDALSQVLQYTYFTVDRQEYALVQVHGGCDVRGGYTAPKCFKAYETELFDNARGEMWCDGGMMPHLTEGQLDMDGKVVDHGCGAAWSTENAGYMWENPGYDIDVRPIGGYNDAEAYPVEEGETGEVGRVTILPDGKAICPHCGNGTLKVAGYPTS